MNALAQERCVACRADSPRVRDEEIAQFRPQIPDWRDGVKQSQRAYKFKNFAQALAFTNRVGELAESEDHPCVRGAGGLADEQILQVAAI